MTSLVVCLGAGKGTWIPVLKLLDASKWDDIFLVMPKFFADKYQPSASNIHKIIVDEQKTVEALVGDIAVHFGKLFGDVAVNLYSGEGIEHMAVLAALMKAGCGIRLVHVHDGRVQEL